jgi:hypothetical protein
MRELGIPDPFGITNDDREELMKVVSPEVV